MYACAYVRCRPRWTHDDTRTLPDDLLTTTRTVRKTPRPGPSGRYGGHPRVPRDRVAGAVGVESTGMAVGGRHRRGSASTVGDIYRDETDRYLESKYAADKLFADDAERSQVQQRVGASVRQPRRDDGPGAGAARAVHQGRTELPAGNQPDCGVAAAGGVELCACRACPGTRDSLDDTASRSPRARRRRDPRIPEGYHQGALIPTAYNTGETFQPAPRAPLDEVLHVDRW